MSDQAQVPTTYERMSDPLAAIERVGKWLATSGMFGCEKPEQGNLLALACMVENKSPLDIARQYHIVKGRLTMRADAMLANLRARGGEYEWLQDGSEGVAELRVTFAGKTRDVQFDMDEAKAMGVVKPDSAWMKAPAAMLRARATSKAMRMMAPEVCAGVYVPEEVEDMREAPRQRELFVKIGEEAARLPAPAAGHVAEAETTNAPDNDFEALENVAQLVKGKEAQALAFLRKAGWLKADEGLDRLTYEQMTNMLSRKTQFLAQITKNGGQNGDHQAVETPDAG